MSEREMNELIYQLYPRKVGKIDALKAIQKQVRWIMQHDCIDSITARRRLYKAVKAYSESPAGQNPDKSKIPHMATWLNRGSFMDDPSEWQIVYGESNGKTITTGTQRTLAAADAFLQRVRDSQSSYPALNPASSRSL
jgi:hypothetical protein